MVQFKTLSEEQLKNVLDVCNSYIQYRHTNFTFSSVSGARDTLKETLINPYENPEDFELAFQEILKNFLLYKDIVLSKDILKKVNVHEYKNRLEKAYFRMENFLYYYFLQLTPENKKYATRFLEIFSQSDICGPTYAKYVFSKDINGDSTIAVKRLIVSVCNPRTHYTLFDESRHHLAIAFKDGLMPGFSPKENRQNAIMSLYSELYLPQTDYQLIEDLNVDMMDMLENRLVSYCKNEWNWRDEVKKERKKHDDEGWLGAVEPMVWFYPIVMCNALSDMVPEEERAEKHFWDVAIEYFSNSKNYPDLSDVDFDEIITDITMRSSDPASLITYGGLERLIPNILAIQKQKSSK